MSNANTNISLTVEAWAEIVIKEWIKKIEALKIHQTGALVQSFTSHIITAANGDPYRVVFAFAWYGRFVDWGVGKGTKIIDRDAKQSVGLTHREEKPWLTSVFWKQLEVLRHLMEEKNSLQIERFMVQNLTTKTT